MGNKHIQNTKKFFQNLIEDPILSNVPYLLNTTLSKALSQCSMFNSAMNTIITLNGPLLPFKCYDIP